MAELTFSFGGLDDDAVGIIVEAIRSVPGVADIVYINVDEKEIEGAYKGDASDLLIKFGEGAIDRIGKALATLLGLPDAPLGTIKIGTPQGQVEFTYDIREYKLEEAVTQMKRLVGELEAPKE